MTSAGEQEEDPSTGNNADFHIWDDEEHVLTNPHVNRKQMHQHLRQGNWEARGAMRERLVKGRVMVSEIGSALGICRTAPVQTTLHTEPSPVKPWSSCCSALQAHPKG